MMRPIPFNRYCPNCGDESIIATAPLNVPARSDSPSLTPNMMINVPPIFIATPRLGRYREEEEDDELDLAMQESFAEAQSPEPHPADPELLESMNRFVYQCDDKEVRACCICMDDVTDGQDVVETPCCRTVTHYECMEKSLCVTSCCPFCRSQGPPKK